MNLLAISDSAQLGMWGANILASVLLGIGMYFLNTRTRRMENLEGRLEEKAEALVESQIAVKTGELTGVMRELSGEIKRINQRLNDGDGSIGKLGERDQKIELAMSQQTKELVLFMQQNFAGKDDVNRLATRIDSLADHLHGVEIDGVKAAVMATKKGGA